MGCMDNVTVLCLWGERWAREGVPEVRHIELVIVIPAVGNRDSVEFLGKLVLWIHNLELEGVEWVGGRCGDLFGGSVSSHPNKDADK